MSNTGKPLSNLSLDSLSDQFKDSSLSTVDNNKPDFRELDLGSPVSPLRTTRASGPAPNSLTTTTTTTSSSSSSSGSVSGRAVQNPASKGHSGELSDTSPTVGAPRTRPGHARSDSCGSSGSHPLIYSGNGSSASSPSLNVLPTGNICPSGRILKTGMATRQSSRTDVLGSGTGNYGHGSIMRAGGSCGGVASNMKINVMSSGNSGTSGDLVKRAMVSLDPEEVKRVGNDQYKRGHFAEALSLYERAIAISPANAAYRSNRAAALTALGRVVEAVTECEEAVRLDPSYGRAQQRLGSLLIRLGQVEVAKKHLYYAGHQPDATELYKLQAVEKHLSRCSDARKIGDWKGALREGDAAIAAGADYCPQLFTCRAESLLKLQQLDDIDSILSNITRMDPSPHCCSQSKFFGMLSEAYLFYVRAQIEMALGRFENAVTLAEKAGKIDPRNIEVSILLNNVRLVARARARGNDLFKSERITEACAAYGEGLRLDPSNSVLYCNRAACWFKLGMWEKSIEDCNHALRIQPSYTKALLRRAASSSKLEQWADAVRDYEVLRRELPLDNEVAESLFHAQVALKKSRGEEVYNMKFGCDVEDILGLDQFRAKISSPGVSVVHFEIASNAQCKRISSFLDILCGRYPAINFLKVDVEGSPDVANAENVRTVPTFKIYKNGSRVKEIVNPTSNMLEASVRHYSF
uniref:Thioredoxin domain-containing protein n=2 Tax=Opuntia streptacantha TaxID=393608 RepID=A0A7C9CL78_OPUST